MQHIEVDPIFQDISAKLGIPDWTWLADLIWFESKFNTTIKNPGSSARGLIQILDSTSRGMFGVDSLTLVNRYPDFESQMYNVVLPYFQQYKTYPTKQSVYMSVFFPAARMVAPSTTFESLYRKHFPNDWQKRYGDFVRHNGSIRTVQDYVNMVDSHARSRPGTAPRGAPPNPPIPVLLLVAGAAAGWYLLRRYG